MQELVSSDERHPDLVEIMRSGGGTMPVTNLWARSGLPIELFYRALRDAVDAGRILETDDKEVLRAA